MNLYLLCGLAFAGKSTLAAAIARHCGAVIVSLDDLNAARGLAGGEGIPVEEWARTHEEALGRVEKALAAGETVVVDDTNCFRFLRDNYRAVARRLGAQTAVIHLDAPFPTALARVYANDREPTRARIREPILRELAEKFEPPGADEAVLLFRAGDDPDDWVQRHLPAGPRPGAGTLAGSRRQQTARPLKNTGRDSGRLPQA